MPIAAIFYHVHEKGEKMMLSQRQVQPKRPAACIEVGQEVEVRSQFSVHSACSPGRVRVLKELAILSASCVRAVRSPFCCTSGAALWTVLS